METQNTDDGQALRTSVPRMNIVGFCSQVIDERQTCVIRPISRCTGTIYLLFLCTETRYSGKKKEKNEEEK